MRDPDLYALCHAFLKEFFQCEEIEKKYYGNKIEFIFQLSDIQEICKKFASYIELVTYMNKNPVISKHIKNMIGLWSYRLNISAWDYIHYLIKRQRKHNNYEYHFNEDKFKEDYIKFEDFFYREYFVMRDGIRLINFVSNLNEIIISDDLKIVKLTEEDYDTLGYGDVTRNSMSEYILQIIYEEKKSFGELNRTESFEGNTRQQERILLLTNTINSLRLFKSGNLKTGEFFSRLTPPVITLGMGTGLVNSYSFPMNRYEINEEEIPDFIALWKEINNVEINSFKEFSIALRRLGYAIDRNRFDDKLVDLVISYESILLKQGELSELNYRMALRSSKLLETDYKKRMEIKKDMTDIYKLRSKIVHGSEYKINPALVSKCEDYLRKSLKKYVICRKIMSHDEILNKLDFSEFS